MTTNETAPSLNADTLVAHRGLQARFPENSLPAFAAALAAGARAFEIDVQLSSDGIPMLYHDADLQRISGLEGRINDLHSRELVQLPAHEPERLGEEFAHQRITPVKELTP
ncbi:MAG: glycerophosphodiester phosphodiesterase family protein, partial [Pseudomonadota bacterium]